MNFTFFYDSKTIDSNDHLQHLKGFFRNKYNLNHKFILHDISKKEIPNDLNYVPCVCIEEKGTILEVCNPYDKNFINIINNFYNLIY